MKKSTFKKLGLGMVAVSFLAAGAYFKGGFDDQGLSAEYCQEQWKKNETQKEIAEAQRKAQMEESVESQKMLESVQNYQTKTSLTGNEFEANGSEDNTSITGLTEVGTNGGTSKSRDFKGLSYADYISADSEQGKMVAMSVVDENGICKINDYVLVSLDRTYGAEIGQVVELITDGGIIEAVVADFKEPDGAVVNFICDKASTSDRVKSFGSFSILDEYAGEITSVNLK